VVVLNDYKYVSLGELGLHDNDQFFTKAGYSIEVGSWNMYIKFLYTLEDVIVP
jgi:hypothetical protein